MKTKHTSKTQMPVNKGKTPKKVPMVAIIAIPKMKAKKMGKC